MARGLGRLIGQSEEAPTSDLRKGLVASDIHTESMRKVNDQGKIQGAEPKEGEWELADLSTRVRSLNFLSQV